jgi:tetratricopeptide (TPR) repeat protein
MSLLLQALQKASRHREGGGAASETSGPPREPELGAHALGEPTPGESPLAERAPHEPTLSELSEASGDPPLSLADAEELFAPEPDAEPEPAPARESPPPPLRPPERPVLRPAVSSGGSAQAATILRASETRSTGVLDWVRDRPVHATLIFALVFAAFYGSYLYLAINHPGVLRGQFPWSEPPRKATPRRAVAPPQQAPPPPASVIAPTPAASDPASAALPGAVPAAGAPGAANTPTSGVKPLIGMPQPAPAPQDRPRSAPRQAQADPDPLDDAPPPAPRRTARAPRTATVEVDAAAMEDSVAVRPPPTAFAAPAQTVMRAWEALQQGRYEEARKLYAEALQADPQSVDALLGLAALAARDGNAEEAGRHYARVLEIEPRNSAAQAGLISIIGQADPLQSETRLKQLIAREPSAFLYFALGNLYARQNLWAQAQPAFFQAYELAPDNPDYAYNLAVGLEHLGQPKIALNYYRRAFELSTLKGHAGFDQARVQERIGQLTARVGSGQ